MLIADKVEFRGKNDQRLKRKLNNDEQFPNKMHIIILNKCVSNTRVSKYVK